MSNLPDPVDAGAFSQWLAAMRAVLRGERNADVPCGSCVGCCISSYPIPLRPEDDVARREVPEQWLIGPARPGERWLMGFREDGSCPFLSEHRCTIYRDRPQTCRDYDCRLYAATGLMPDGDRPEILERVKAWRFRFDAAREHAEAAALHAAAHFIRAHADLFPAPLRAHSATAAAVMAVKAWEVFMPGPAGKADGTPETLAQRVTQACAAFDRQVR